MDVVEKLLEQKRSPLPGQLAQLEMAPIGRELLFNPKIPFKQAAVLMLIYPAENDSKMVFIRRTSHDKDVHSAQISFPGGRMEEGDSSVVEGAIREANEEINVNPKEVELIRLMTPLKIPVSKYEVHPVLAFSKQKPLFIPQESEVDQILEFPLNKIIDPKYKERQRIQLSNGAWIKDVPVFNFSGEVIWGATAMMLNEIVHIIRKNP